MLNKAKEYYDDRKERFREEARNKYSGLSREKKYIKREYGRDRYKNMPEENKQRLKEYVNNYRKAKKLV